MTKWERRFIVLMTLSATEADLKSCVKDFEGGYAAYKEVRSLTRAVILLRREARELGIKSNRLVSSWVDGAVDAYQDGTLIEWLDEL